MLIYVFAKVSFLNLFHFKKEHMESWGPCSIWALIEEQEDKHIKREREIVVCVYNKGRGDAGIQFTSV